MTPDQRFLKQSVIQLQRSNNDLTKALDRHTKTTSAVIKALMKLMNEFTKKK